MAVNNSMLRYYSGWEIDQLYASSDVAVTGTGIRSIYTIPAGLPAVPDFEVQFKPTGSTNWYLPGQFSTNGSLASTTNFYSYIQNGSIYINTNSTGTARYFVWIDKVDY